MKNKGGILFQVLSPDTLNAIISSVKKFLEPFEVEKCLKIDQNSEISKISVGSEKQDLRPFSTSSGSKNFFTGDMITFKVSKRLPQTKII